MPIEISNTKKLTRETILIWFEAHGAEVTEVSAIHAANTADANWRVDPVE